MKNKKNNKENAYKAIGYGSIAQLSRNKRINKAGKVAMGAGCTYLIGNGIWCFIKLLFMPVYIIYLFFIWVPIKYIAKLFK